MISKGTVGAKRAGQIDDYGDVDSRFVTAGDVHLCQDHPVPDVPIQAPTRQISDHWWRTGFFLLSSLILCVLDFLRGIANFNRCGSHLHWADQGRNFKPSIYIRCIYILFECMQT